MIDLTFVDTQQDLVKEDIPVSDPIFPMQVPSDIKEVPQRGWLAKLRRMFCMGK